MAPFSVLLLGCTQAALEIFVSPTGSDSAAGTTLSAPLRSL